MQNGSHIVPSSPPRPTRPVSADDPRPPLTRREEATIAYLSQLPREQILKELKENLQTAIWIELATIPIYLFTYYSIDRNRVSGENIGAGQLFANRAGGVIMSVAVEEMLHMSLAGNVLHALGGDPQLYLCSPPSYPASLPYHRPRGPRGPDGARQDLIPLGKLSFEQLWHFLQIEYAEKRDAPPQDRNWDTIGQFYSYIRCLILCPQLRDEDFQVRGGGADGQQIQPFNYSPNNIDTAYPRQAFDPWGLPPSKAGGAGPSPHGAAPNGAAPNAPRPYPSAARATAFPNAGDSHSGRAELITVASKPQALQAIDTICAQGEGFEHERTDDPSRAELSHYYKFLTLQAQLDGYSRHIEQLPASPPPPAPVTPLVTAAELGRYVFDFPDNPTTQGYVQLQSKQPGSVDYAPLSNLVNGLYQYMFILTETVYRVPAAEQKRYFNQALHGSMIWILDKLIQKMRAYTLSDGTALAPTFENVDLGSRDQAFANLQQLCEATQPAPYYDDIQYYIGRISALPDVSQYWAPGWPKPAHYAYRNAPKWPTQIGAQPTGASPHACMGLNSCRAQDRFGLAGPVDGPTPGQPNACAGRGYCSTANDHTCHVQNECKGQGGCGLYGTGHEQNHPGANECKSLGSCATPINAERFSTDGPNRGRSVWARARAVFEERWPELRQRLPDAPAELGPVPAPFAQSGPAYLWITDDNTERGNMAACGASGLSGAGGCT